VAALAQQSLTSPGVSQPHVSLRLAAHLPRSAYYANGGIYPWLSCTSAINRLRGGALAEGAAVWNATTATMLWGPQNAATREQVFEYMNGDTGVSDG
jgi:hypothetical protein